jgi:hypothetical protein
MNLYAYIENTILAFDVNLWLHTDFVLFHIQKIHLL